jgi:heat shock protein HtpX
LGRAFSYTVDLMGKELDSFWQLERANRRKTAELVVIFILVYCFLGLGLDLIFHTFRIVNHRLIGFPALTIVAAVIAVAQALRAYYRGSSVLIGAVGAHDLASESVKTQMVADVVNEIALAAGIPRPRLCLMEDPAPNAFAAGRDPAHSVICVTQGLVDQLDREELQGVIAHEMAHIRGHDTRITQMAAVMVSGFALVSGSILRAAAARGGRTTIPGYGFVAIPVLIVSGIGWLFSKIAAIALSRQREYLADAAAVEFTRNPTALIRALEHIARIESPLRASLRGVAPLFIVDPFECGDAGGGEFLDEVARIEALEDKTKERRDAEGADLMVKGMPQQNLFLFRGVLSSHPPIHDRIARLYGLLHQPSAGPTPDQINAKRKAAAKVVAEVTKTNSEAAAAVIESMLRAPLGEQFLRVLGANLPPRGPDPTQASPGEELLRALGANLPGNGPDPARPAAEDQTYDKLSDQAAYQKLYEYNLGLTGDKPRSQTGHLPGSESLLGAILGGKPLTTIDPAQLRAALATGMASMHKKSAAAPEGVATEQPPSKKPHYLFWLMIAVSAGAIIAALALK